MQWDFLPDDKIKRDYIIPLNLEGKNISTNVHAFHWYFHYHITIHKNDSTNESETYSI